MDIFLGGRGEVGGGGEGLKFIVNVFIVVSIVVEII